MARRKKESKKSLLDLRLFDGLLPNRDYDVLTEAMGVKRSGGCEGATLPCQHCPKPM